MRPKCFLSFFSNITKPVVESSKKCVQNVFWRFSILYLDLSNKIRKWVQNVFSSTIPRLVKQNLKMRQKCFSSIFSTIPRTVNQNLKMRPKWFFVINVIFKEDLCWKMKVQCYSVNPSFGSSVSLVKLFSQTSISLCTKFNENSNFCITIILFPMNSNS